MTSKYAKRSVSEGYVRAADVGTCALSEGAVMAAFCWWSDGLEVG